MCNVLKFKILCSDSFLRYPFFRGCHASISIMRVVKNIEFWHSHLAANRQSYRELMGTLPVYQRFGCNLLKTLLQRASETNNGRRPSFVHRRIDKLRFLAFTLLRERSAEGPSNAVEWPSTWKHDVEATGDQPDESLRSYLRSIESMG